VCQVRREIKELNIILCRFQFKGISLVGFVAIEQQDLL